MIETTHKDNSHETSQRNEQDWDLGQLEEYQDIIAWQSTLPLCAYGKLEESTCHTDCGANSFIFKKRQHFWKYQKIKISVRIGDGNYCKETGIGILLITFADLLTIFPFYPCYHMSGNPQDIFSPPACKQYIPNIRNVRYETLESLKITIINNKWARITTKQKYNYTEIQNYMKINIMTTQHFSTDQSRNTYRIQNKPILLNPPPQLNHSFTKMTTQIGQSFTED